jgi:very-short-patch-repair endonuclease
VECYPQVLRRGRALQARLEQHGRMRMPSDAASQWEWLCFHQAGVVTWQQAAGLLSPAKVRHLLATGRWRRLCRGVLVTFTGELRSRQQLWAALLAAGPGAALAGLAAARLDGLSRIRTRRDRAIDVLVPAQRRAADLRRRMPAEMPAVFVRRTRHLPKRELMGRPVRTPIERSVVDAAQWAATDQEARTILATACQQRLVSPSDLLERAARMPRLCRRGLIQQTARDLAGGPDALSEIDLSHLCRRFGLPAPEHQLRRRDARGRVRYVDAYWRRWRLQVEVDGAHHMDVSQWEADMRRQNDIWLAGDRILRFTAFEIRHRPAEVAEQIRRALLAAGWQLCQ